MDTVANLEVTSSRHFPAWLADQQISLAITTYQANKLFLLGLKPDGRLAVQQRVFPRCMGLTVADGGQTLWLTSQFQIWRLVNALPEKPRATFVELDDDGDRLFVPRLGYTTGDIDAHDIAIDADGQVVFVNTLFSCLATVSDRCNFQPLWRPPFISKLAAEDRCHLNGMAMRDGRPRYVTACSRSDVADGWRDHRTDGGLVIEVPTGEAVATGLSMPHSPRWHRDRLWLLDSGRGDFGWVDLVDGKFQPVAMVPGYARGLALVGNWALVGISQPRHEATFAGLPLDQRLAERGATARCGVQVIDLQSGDTAHWLRIEGSAHELYDVAVLPGVIRPKALGFQTEEIRRHVWFEDEHGRATSWSAGDKN